MQQEDFVLEENVQLGMLPEFELLKNQATSEIVGSGKLRLDRTGLSRFYTFVNGEFVEFYPENRVVEKFFLVTEELHRLNGGKWKDFDFSR